MTAHVVQHRFEQVFLALEVAVEERLADPSFVGQALGGRSAEAPPGEGPDGGFEDPVLSVLSVELHYLTLAGLDHLMSKHLLRVRCQVRPALTTCQIWSALLACQARPALIESGSGGLILTIDAVEWRIDLRVTT